MQGTEGLLIFPGGQSERKQAKFRLCGQPGGERKLKIATPMTPKQGFVA
jgi:hypothetical protein